jgi:gliding motility-associated-like protein
MKPKNFFFIVSILFSSWMMAQNLVPNPSFESMDECDGIVNPELWCAEDWSEFLDSDPVNTPDLGFEGAVFFPPSTAEAFDGNQYLNLECSTGNPEYVQVSLLEPLIAGTSYCVSFYTSVYEESTEVAPSLGVYFTDEPLTNSPFELNLQAHVQGPIEFNPDVWTLVSGTFNAQGGEDILVLGGFENTDTMPFPYMYIDMVSVIPMPPMVLADVELCGATVALDAFAPNANYEWSTGETSSSIEVSATGIFELVRTIGVCSQEIEVEVLECEEDEDTPDPDTDPEEEEPSGEPEAPAISAGFNFYIPNAFTPDDDGTNDVFGVVGPDTDTFRLQVYNRWGQLVFESEDIQKHWTGNHSGGAHYVPDGVYIYQVRATSGLQLFEKQGHVMVMR